MKLARTIARLLGAARRARGTAPCVRLGLLALFFCVVGLQSARAQLTVAPVTWNVIGLDSNKYAQGVGPDTFQVGARACNTGGTAIANVTGTFFWDSANPYINLAATTANPITYSSLPVGTCTDYYFPVTVSRVPQVFTTNPSRRYHITVSGNGVPTVSTPTPRELYVEQLLSQSRNKVISITGPATVYVGQTYTYRLIADTSTNGYDQLESFINLSNVVFQVMSINTTYTAPPPGVTNDKFYADACGWDNVPGSPTYLSCANNNKVGGTITTDYTVKILSVSGTITLSGLILDHSGGSFHYNGDFGGNGMPITTLPPPLTLAKTASPSPVLTSGTVTYTLRLTNSGPAAYTLADFVDTPPTSPGSPAYVAGSSTFNGAAISNPTIAGGKLTWTGTFLIPAGTSRDLVYRMAMPNTHGTYTNSAIAHFDSYQVDTTQDTTDNMPATASVQVNTPPNIALDKQCTAPANCASQGQAPGTELTYTLTFTNNGDTTASSFIIYDMIPANTTFKVGSVTYNAGTSGIGAPTVDYSQQARSNATPPVPPAPWVAYAPPGAAGTFDATVTWIRWSFNANTIPSGKSASITFTVRIN